MLHPFCVKIIIWPLPGHPKLAKIPENAQAGIQTRTKMTTLKTSTSGEAVGTSNFRYGSLNMSV